MATAGEMTRIVAEALSLPHTTVASYFRMLREGGLMTEGGRGRSAPQMTSLDVARLVVALLSADALAEAVAATELVGQSWFLGVCPKEDGRGFFDDPTPEQLEGPEPDDNYEYEEPEELTFERALADLIEFKAAGCAGSPGWFSGSLDNRLKISVTATRLTAEISADGYGAYFRPGSSVAVTDPDDWEGMSIKERLRARAELTGLTVIREIGEIELFRLSAAVAAGSTGPYPH